jgi:hypothetical protein
VNPVLVVAAVALFLGGIVVGVVLVARSGRRDGRRGGARSAAGAGVPASWRRSHDPEARLHRRLGQVVAALDALPADDVTTDVRAAVARAAAALDERLVAVAALPPRVRAEPLAHLTTEVDGLEEAVAAVTTRTAAGSDVTPALRALSERLALLDAARAEVDSLAPGAEWPPPPPTPPAPPTPPPPAPAG